MKSKLVPSTRGGIRIGAGRKIGSGKFREPTSVVRIPSSQAAVIQDFLAAYQKKRLATDLDAVTAFELPHLQPRSIALPLFSSKVSAGLPDTAEAHIEKRLDPNDFLIDHQESTFFVTIQGYSMMDAGLLPGDKAVIDRAKTANIGDIVLALINGEFTIKTLGRQKTGIPRLLPANKDFKPIDITADMHFEIWGVVTGSFRRFR